MADETHVLKLIGAQKAEFNFASRKRTWVIRVQIAIALLTAFCVPITSDYALYAAALLSMILVGVWFWLAEGLTASRAHAERLRRASVIAGGLGIEISGAEYIELMRDGMASDSEKERLVDPDYFASRLSPGPQRMAEMLEESAIWTANLAKIAARETWLIFGGTSIVLVFALLGAAMVVSITQWQLGARAVGIILSGILSAD